MNQRPILLLLLFIGSSLSTEAQDLYYIYFTDKDTSQAFNPHAYFDERAIERRLRHELPLYDEKDLPINTLYTDKIDTEVELVRHQLRWFNAISVEAWPDQIEKIKSFPFVKRIEAFTQHTRIAAWEEIANEKLDTLLALGKAQTNFKELEEHGLTGKGARIAIFDTGFKRANEHEAFEHLRKDKQIVQTYDFYEGKEDVYHHDDHGTQVLSCIGGIYEGKQLGAAKDAEFLLARTEHKSKEKAIEEDHWLAAAEWADKHGADIINSSLTYTSKRYEYEDMDGKKTLVSRAAKTATDKGILVVVSMGNDGGNKWKYLGAPADVAEVLSVGASMPFMPARLKFSSFGPNASGVSKPDISAPGYVVVANGKGKYAEAAGTSFSAPLICGFAACLMQKNPAAKRKEIFEQVRQSGHYFPYYDYELGYGVVNASKLFTQDSLIQNTFSVQQSSDSVFVAFNPELMKDSLDFPNGRMLYVHLEDKEAKLSASFQLPVENKARYFFYQRDPEFEGIMRIWFAGYLWEEKIEQLQNERSRP
ncbi:MAG: S8 family serine peptidase [Bacteroidia bacterium]|nr:S8 family serine peptidase [Bacteroidia bacterium]